MRTAQIDRLYISAADTARAMAWGNRKPDLRALAIRAIETAAAFDAYTGDGPEWDRRNRAAFDARCEFLIGLQAHGIDKSLLDSLLNEGVLS